MIDIVITYLNPRDKQWQEDFNYWKDKEIKEGKTTPSNRQAFGEERTREWDTLKYWFRGIEKNCPWVNKVFLVCQNERHVPKWLNRDNPKLRIVYHDEYIPEELLPTFNAMTISLFIDRIEDLSEHYIMSDDDYYFLNPIKEDHFFKEGKPIHPDNRTGYFLYATKGTDGVFFKILNNNLRFEAKITGKRIKYGFYHLPEARLKSFGKWIIDKNYKEFIDRNICSKFRNEKNLCSYMYSDLLKLCNKAYIGDPYKNSCYCGLDSNVDFNNYKDKDMVCFNDTERLDDYDKTKEKFVEFLKEKFPNKSSFEI